MKKIAALIATGLVALSVARADDGVVTSSNVDLTWASQYNWRGQVLADFTMHPSVTLGFLDDSVSAGFWAATPMEKKSNYYNEYDYFITYAYSINDSLSLTAGATAYVFRQPPSGGSDAETYEAFISGTYLWTVSEGNTIALSASFYQELDNGFGDELNYLEGSASYSIALGAATVTFDGFIGYIEKADYTYGGVKASIEYPLSSNGLYVAASVSHTEEIDNELSSENLDDVVYTFSIGISL